MEVFFAKAAPPKNKKNDLGASVAINRLPLRGFKPPAGWLQGYSNLVTMVLSKGPCKNFFRFIAAVPFQSAGMPRTPNASRTRARILASHSVWSAAYPAALDSWNRFKMLELHPQFGICFCTGPKE